MHFKRIVKIGLVSILFLAFLNTCKKDEFSVPDDFLVYVHRFESEASLRGRILDIENQGLKVEFADFTGRDYVGLTKHENPVRIQIDRNYWNANSDLFREFVIFHELAHGFLGIREHRNDTLPNGEWKSIMRGPPANSNDHKIYYDKHRDYYLDELFLDTVAHPPWSYKPPFIVLAPTDTNFGLIPVKSSISKYFTIRNDRETQVFIDSVRASDCFNANFSGTIQPGDSVRILITFSPKEQTQYGGTIKVYHSVLHDVEIKPLTFEVIGEGSASSSVGEWIEITPFPGAARYEAAFFSIDNSGFVCLGTTYGNTVTKEVWELNPDNQWIKKNEFPGEARNYPVGFSVDGKGYLGLGLNRTDFWEYDHSTDTWRRKSDFPGGARIMSVYTATSGKGYVGTGYNGYTWFKDFWEYDPASDKWTRLPDYPGKANINAVAFTINDRIFVGTGSDGSQGGNANSDFWEYNATAKKWSRRSDYAGGKTIFAIGFSINNYGYLGGGTGEDGTGTNNSFWEYDPIKDNWSKKANIPWFSSGGVYFSTGSKGYFGIGFMTSPYFWEFLPVN